MGLRIVIPYLSRKEEIFMNLYNDKSPNNLNFIFKYYYLRIPITSSLYSSNSLWIVDLLTEDSYKTLM